MMLWFTSLGSNGDDVVDLMDNSIGGDRITFNNSSILDFWTAGTIRSQLNVVETGDGAKEGPLGFGEARTAFNPANDVIVDDMLQGDGFGYNVVVPLANLLEYRIDWCEHCERFGLISEELRHVG